MRQTSTETAHLASFRIATAPESPQEVCHPRRKPMQNATPFSGKRQSFSGSRKSFNRIRRYRTDDLRRGLQSPKSPQPRKFLRSLPTQRALVPREREPMRCQSPVCHGVSSAGTIWLSAWGNSRGIMLSGRGIARQIDRLRSRPAEDIAPAESLTGDSPRDVLIDKKGPISKLLPTMRGSVPHLRRLSP